MREISVENDGKMPISKILDRAMLSGVDEATVRTLVSKMQQNGIIYQPPNTPGTYEFV
jgi:DNA replicative helicase MCM subunit Mcm2 (Cdc46/Mcm family)